jgi:glycosyltransferase involved in cell wall biosynthesis
MRTDNGVAARDSATHGRRRVWLVGGPDVDARIDLMRVLQPDFDVGAVGTDPALGRKFAEHGFAYRAYRMSNGVNPARDVLALWQLYRLFRVGRPDIVHTFDTKPGVWARLAARWAGVPVVVGTLPGLGSLYSRQSLKGRLVRLVYQPLQAIACRLADRTIFQNPDDAREFEERRVVPRGKAVLVGGSGVRTDLFAPLADRDPDDSAYREELGLPPGGLVVLTVTRVLRTKGVLELARAAAEVQRQDPTIRFVLAGPADEHSFEALTQDELEELRGALTWLGARRDVKRLLELADIFVYPSYYREGIPRALLEASSMALPLIAADVAGSREVVKDGVNGYLIAPRDPRPIAERVLQLAGDPDLRARFAEAARRRAVSDFDLAVIAGRTASLYRELLHSTGQ